MAEQRRRSISTPGHLYERLRAQCERDGLPVAAVVQRLIEQHLGDARPIEVGEHEDVIIASSTAEQHEMVVEELGLWKAGGKPQPLLVAAVDGIRVLRVPRDRVHADIFDGDTATSLSRADLIRAIGQLTDGSTAWWEIRDATGLDEDESKRLSAIAQACVRSPHYLGGAR